MQGCSFCAIIAGESEGSFVAASSRAVAFLDTLPVGTGHTLVVPRRHAVGLADLDPEDGAELFRLGQRIAMAQWELGLADGVNLFMADGGAAGQEIWHAHLHVIPRRADDALVLHMDYDPPPERDALDDLAARLRHALDPEL
jgi:histidine triad (HIT) family protein